MAKGKIKRLFPGGNTCKGFHSFYDFIIEPDATRIFCIKGGPGVGKSTFMRWIGEQMLEKGYDVEFHCCSSDNNSLDGIVIPSLRIAMLDGTAPHIVDPKNPGVVDEIIHLGDYWNEKKMVSSKKEVLKLNAQVSRFFTIAYNNLKEAKGSYDQWEFYLNECIDTCEIRQISNNLLEKIFQDACPQYNVSPKIRRLFASAITPEGSVNHLSTILEGIEKLYIIKGDPGTGVEKTIAQIANSATEKGLDIEAYHCSFNPEKIDCVIIPQLKIGIVHGSKPIDFNPNLILSLNSMQTINFNQFLNKDLLLESEKEILAAQERFWIAFQRAINFIRQAKAVHDEMEKYYIPAMDFAAINQKREETLQRILKYAQECH